MAKSKVTRPKAARNASKSLRSRNSGAKTKAAAGSALSQSKSPKKITSKRAASAASSVLRDGRTAKKSKSAAGSALSQRPSKNKKK